MFKAYAHSMLLRSIQRYSFLLLKRLTLRRLANLIRLLIEMKLRIVEPYSYPIVARINTYPFCNLRCPGCFGKKGNQLNNSSRHVMTYNEYKLIIDKLAPHLLFVILYDEGEPLLHNDISKMIKYTASQNISVSISTNFSMPLSDNAIDELVLSGLDKLIVAIDGMSQEVYEKYRVGGSLERVKDNLKRVIAAKKKHGLKYPFIEVQYLNFGYNAHQINEAEKFSYSAGVDHFSTIKASPQGGLGQSWGTEADRIKGGCFHLWSVATIDSKGLMYPCDFGEDEGMKPLGSLYHNSLKELWNCSEMKNLRRSFNRKSPYLYDKRCNKCSISTTIPFFLR